MGTSYITLWSGDRCKTVGKMKHTGRPITRLFGGAHSSMPGYKKYGVKPGDYLYIVRTNKGDMLIFGRMLVDEMLSLDEYKRRFPSALPDEDYRYMVSGGLWPSGFEDLRYLIPTCCDEAVLGSGTGIGLDIMIPSEKLETVAFVNSKGERPLKCDENGKLTSILSIQGHTLRLNEQSATLFDGLVSEHLRL